MLPIVQFKIVEQGLFWKFRKLFALISNNLWGKLQLFFVLCKLAWKTFYQSYAMLSMIGMIDW